jgi:ATP-binding cassette subfamily B multidrug efflux pump
MSGRSTPTRPGPAPEAGTTAVGRPPRPPMGPGRGGPFAGMNIPAEKAMNFWPSARRLLGQLQPERLWLMLVLVLGVAGVTLSVIGPRLLGEGTNIIFAGVVSKQLPAGTSKAELIAQLRAAGENQKADMLSAMALTPGAGIDFTALAGVLLWALVLYVLASGFMWIQAYVLNGVVQRTVFRLRERIEAKINRLPLRYFDSIQRGELLSRVTNDVDNISQSLQQSISQAVMSLLTVAGRAADDVPALAHAGGDCAGDHSADAGDHGADRQALAEAVRGAMEAHGGAERADRGDLYRACAGEGVRPAARGGGALPAEERRAV